MKKPKGVTKSADHKAATAARRGVARVARDDKRGRLDALADIRARLRTARKSRKGTRGDQRDQLKTIAATCPGQVKEKIAEANAERDRVVQGLRRECQDRRAGVLDKFRPELGDLNERIDALRAQLPAPKKSPATLASEAQIEAATRDFEANFPELLPLWAKHGKSIARAWKKAPGRRSLYEMAIEEIGTMGDAEIAGAMSQIGRDAWNEELREKLIEEAAKGAPTWSPRGEHAFPAFAKATDRVEPSKRGAVGPMSERSRFAPPMRGDQAPRSEPTPSTKPRSSILGSLLAMAGAKRDAAPDSVPFSVPALSDRALAAMGPASEAAPSSAPKSSKRADWFQSPAAPISVPGDPFGGQSPIAFTPEQLRALRMKLQAEIGALSMTTGEGSAIYGRNGDLQDGIKSRAHKEAERALDRAKRSGVGWAQKIWLEAVAIENAMDTLRALRAMRSQIAPKSVKAAEPAPKSAPASLPMSGRTLEALDLARIVGEEWRPRTERTRAAKRLDELAADPAVKAAVAKVRDTAPQSAPASKGTKQAGTMRNLVDIEYDEALRERDDARDAFATADAASQYGKTPSDYGRIVDRNKAAQERFRLADKAKAEQSFKTMKWATSPAVAPSARAGAAPARKTLLSAGTTSNRAPWET